MERASPIPVSPYQKRKEIVGVRGFVVNIHDAVNYDIDLLLPPRYRKRYRSAIVNRYYYRDISIDDPDSSPLIQGTTYRCRVRGVGIHEGIVGLKRKRLSEAKNEVNRCIDSVGGWVVCRVSDIDIFHRILVEMIVPLPTPIAVRTLLLCPKNEGVYYPYNQRGQRTKPRHEPKEEGDSSPIQRVLSATPLRLED